MTFDLQFVKRALLQGATLPGATPLWIWAGRLGSALTIIAALVLATFHQPPMRWLFVAWTCSNALWLWYGWKLSSGSLVSAQAVFLMIDAVGVMHYWILGNGLWMRMFS